MSHHPAMDPDSPAYSNDDPTWGEAPPPKEIDARRAYADGLRAIAAWFETHPEVPLPDSQRVDVASLNTKEEAASVARALGACDKIYDGTLFRLERRFGGTTLRFLFWRDQVCERRVVSTKQVPARLVPAHTEEIVEWDCHPLLASDQAAEGDPC